MLRSFHCCGVSISRVHLDIKHCCQATLYFYSNEVSANVSVVLAFVLATEGLTTVTAVYSKQASFIAKGIDNNTSLVWHGILPINPLTSAEKGKTKSFNILVQLISVLFHSMTVH